PVDAADASGRTGRETLLPDARFQIVGEEMETLRNAVMSTKVDPFFREGIEGPGTFPAEQGRRLPVGGALLDPLIDRMPRPVGAEAKKCEEKEDVSTHDAPLGM